MQSLVLTVWKVSTSKYVPSEISPDLYNDAYCQTASFKITTWKSNTSFNLHYTQNKYSDIPIKYSQFAVFHMSDNAKYSTCWDQAIVQSSLNSLTVSHLILQ